MGVLKVVRAAEQSGDQSLDSVEEMMERCGDWGLLPLIYPVQCVARHLVPAGVTGHRCIVCTHCKAVNFSASQETHCSPLLLLLAGLRDAR